MNKIRHARICPECDEETYQFERCHRCGDIPWKSDESPHDEIDEPTDAPALESQPSERSR